MSNGKTQLVKRELIQIDPDVQPREKIDQETVQHYREDMDRGDEFPLPVLFFDGELYWPGDGIHRILAREGQPKIEGEVRKGTRKDARLFACGANQKHGLQRTGADKRRAVRMALEEMPDASDRKIAEHVGVGHPLVGMVRSQLEEIPPDGATNTDADEPSTGRNSSSTRTGRDGKQRPAHPTRQTSEGSQDTEREPWDQPQEHPPDEEQRSPADDDATDAPSPANGKPSFDDRKVLESLRKLSVLFNDRANALKQQKSLAWKTVRNCMESLLEAWETWQKEGA